MRATQIDVNTVRYSSNNGDSKVVTCVYDAHGCEDYDYAVFLGENMGTLWGTVTVEGDELHLTVEGDTGVWRYSNDADGWLLLAQEAG